LKCWLTPILVVLARDVLRSSGSDIPAVHTAQQSTRSS